MNKNTKIAAAGFEPAPAAKEATMLPGYTKPLYFTDEPVFLFD